MLFRCDAFAIVVSAFPVAVVGRSVGLSDDLRPKSTEGAVNVFIRGEDGLWLQPVRRITPCDGVLYGERFGASMRRVEGYVRGQAPHVDNPIGVSSATTSLISTGN